jgi:hypothetical protein
MCEDVFGDRSQLMADLDMLAVFRWYRKTFAERLVAATKSQDEEDVLPRLRSEAAYQLAEFYYGLKALNLRTEEHIRALAERHNDHMVRLERDPAKMQRLGVTQQRINDAMFTSDVLPRLVQTWCDRPGTIDQSNLARLLTGTMSQETCRKALIACAKAGFLMEEKTPYGPTTYVSTGVLEDTLGRCVREARQRIVGRADSPEEVA